MKSYQSIRNEKGLKELKIPRVLYSNVTDGILIMENLKTKGFQLLDRIHNEGKMIQNYSPIYLKSFNILVVATYA